MTILFIIPNLLEIGGSEKSLIKLVNSLAENPTYDIHVGVLSEFRKEDFELTYNSRINIFSLGGFSAKNPRLWISLIRNSRKINPDILCAWSILVSSLVLFLRPFLSYGRLYLSIRNAIYSYRIHQSWYHPLSWIYGFAISQLFRKADVITANSQTNLEKIKMIIGEKPKYYWLPNTIKIDELKKKSKIEVPNLYSENSYKLLFVGRLEHQKGLDLILEVLSKVKEDIPFELVIVGTGSLENKLKYMTKSLGIDDRIKWMGYQSNVYSFYAACDVLLFPSRHEGFPNVLLEAMTLNCSVIAADCPTGPAEITKNGSLGLLFEVDNLDQLQDHIQFAFSHQKEMKEMGSQAGMNIAEFYDVKSVSKKYFEIFNEMKLEII